MKDPLGVGGERLHEWMYPLAVFHEMHGEKGEGEVTRARPWCEAGGTTSAPSSWAGTCSEAADGKDVWLTGGPGVIGPYLRAGLLDEIEISLAPGVTHISYRVERDG